MTMRRALYVAALLGVIATSFYAGAQWRRWTASASSLSVLADALDRAFSVPVPCPKGSVEASMKHPSNGGSLITGTCNLVIGRFAGFSMTDERRMILIGERASAPPHSDGFVNLANVACFWRDSGWFVECPAPDGAASNP